ncbi:hypothetical protein RSP795_10125 [Ralstonia solanacearum]|uniref:hypothetical protein n=1 Tax=Ralstonia solanacearum TaxID=305 RepID=UPI0007D757D1|nr:hypothetical protein [Ralstonia solanacearum]OAI62791.1 hypothetical protein RSP795_10125 [Ralstonia solanacearum]
MTIEQVIKGAMARAFFASAYADAWDDAVAQGMETDLNPSGRDWLDMTPKETDPAAIRAARTLVFDFERVNSGTHIVALFFRVKHIAIEAGEGDREPNAENFGHYVAMQAMGSGIGLCDAFGKTAGQAVRVPYTEFRAHSLERDYFNAGRYDEADH